MNAPKLIVANWKMHGLARDLAELAALAAVPAPADLVVCPPFPLLHPAAAALAGSAVALGGQDCHARVAGPHTGDVSAEMLADAGCAYVIIGHSERRADCGETDRTARAKVDAAWRAGLTPILCVGETLVEREEGLADTVIAAMLEASLPRARSGPLVIAYEPRWAIGTGHIPTLADMATMHAEIHARLAHHGLAGTRVLYGGSVKPANAAAILAVPGVDGALVGAASLTAASLLAIADAAPARSLAA